MRFRPVLVLALVLAALGSSCRKATVESYRIPKEKDPEMPLAATAGGGTASAADATSANAPASSPAPGSAGSSMANTAVPTASGDALTWTAPAKWKSKPASAMRKATYAVPGAAGGGDAELAISAFPGDVGGELANVNRWRGQLQLDPIAESDLASQVQRIEHHGLKFGVVELTGRGAAAQRMLGAFVRVGEATWFFKLSGPDATVAAAKPDFLDFLATIQPAAPAS